MDADRTLVEAVLANRAGAFEQLVRDYQGLCWHIIQRMVRHPEDTRELCQEAFLRVHRYLQQYRFDSPLKSWIGQVAYSVAKRHLERKRIALADMHVGGGMDEDDGPSLLDNIGDGVMFSTPSGSTYRPILNEIFLGRRPVAEGLAAAAAAANAAMRE